MPLVGAVIKETEVAPGLAAGQKVVPRLARCSRAEQRLGSFVRSRYGHDLERVARKQHVHQGAAESQLVDDGLHHKLQGQPQIQTRGDTPRQLRQEPTRLCVMGHRA